MYHIPDDKRAKKSAVLLSEALLECLKSKDFDKISVSDLNKKSFVSRSTFYRLFDTTLDLLRYMCDTMFEEIIREIRQREFSGPTEMMGFFNREIMSKDALLDALVGSGRIDILYSTHSRHASELFPFFTAYDDTMTEKEDAYILRILSASLCAYIGYWAETGRKESPEELSGLVRKSFHVIASATT